jgi:LacI family transcriptional regulator
MPQPFQIALSCAGSGGAIHPLLRGLHAASPSPEFWKIEVVLEPGQALRHPSLKRVVRRSDALVTMFWWDDVNAFLDAGKPVVRISEPAPGNVAPSVIPDDRRIGKQGAEHLLGLGLEQLAIVGPARPWSRARAAGFVRAARHARANVHLAGVGPKTGRWSFRSFERRETLERWLLSLPRPVGMMCAADWVAEEILHACLHCEIHVPDEVAILGVDNTDIRCDFAAVPLSSVDPGMENLASEAGALVARMLCGEEVSAQPVMVEPLGVVQRASTKTIAVADEYLRRALTFIQDRYSDNIDVSDILEEVPISRSSLERRFRARLGRSPGQELRRVRLEAARDLLAKTDLPLVDIAVRTGFEYISYLSKSFKEHFGLTPSRYRSQQRRTLYPSE